MERFLAANLIHTGITPSIRKVDDFIAFIREANELLQQETDLSPANRRVTSMIGRLSQHLRSPYSPEEIRAVLGNDYIAMNLHKLREKLSKAEFQVELADSRLMCESDDGSLLNRIAKLPYWDVYTALVSEELSALRQFAGQAERLEKSPTVFVGSGPMPLSPLLIHLLCDVEVICLDIDSAACEASRCFLEKTGLQTKISVIWADGAEFDYSPYTRVFVASLVQNKQAVLEQIAHTSPDPLVAVRTAEGIKQVMYESIRETELSRHGWRILCRTRPDGELVINSTLFLSRTPLSALTD